MFNLFSFYIKACEDEVSPEMEVLAIMTMETSLRDSDLVGVPGSLIAAAALCMAKWILDTSSSFIDNSALEKCSGYRAEKLIPVMKMLACNILTTDITQKINKEVIEGINTNCMQVRIKTKYENYKFVQNILHLTHNHPRQRSHARPHLRLVQLSNELVTVSDIFSS